MADVRFLILVGPPSLDPTRMGFPPQEPTEPAPPVPLPAKQTRRRPTGQLVGAVAPGWYAWRLMASNNRRLASSVSSFRSRQYAVDAIDELKSDLSKLRAHVTSNPHDGTWSWRVVKDGISVAVCPHWYERERDCRSGVARFIDAVPRAQVTEGGMVLRDRHGPMSGTFGVRGTRR